MSPYTILSQSGCCRVLSDQKLRFSFDLKCVVLPVCPSHVKKKPNPSPWTLCTPTSENLFTNNSVRIGRILFHLYKHGSVSESVSSGSVDPVHLLSFSCQETRKPVFIGTKKKSQSVTVTGYYNGKVSFVVSMEPTCPLVNSTLSDVLRPPVTRSIQWPDATFSHFLDSPDCVA